MEMRGMMGGFYKLSEWIMRLSVTNVLWLLTSFPFWLMVISLLNVGDADALKASHYPACDFGAFHLVSGDLGDVLGRPEMGFRRYRRPVAQNFFPQLQA